ncbi:MAG: hypothetical protein KBB01_06995 [Candidatus Omnitrophica bacterium]|jgi:DNA repair photolyase|nr:hypothetical protein [Candidatus Omnitrophota bacterium]
MELKIIHTQRLLSPTQISLADYVINPYRGCTFGCIYCYSQINKNLKKYSFGGSLGIKINAVEILEKELQYKSPKRVLLGSTTECFQQEELNYSLTKKIMELLNANSIPYLILTKSHLIANYLDIIGKNPENKIFFTLNFHSDSIIRAFEPRSSLITDRLKTIESILDHKINLRIHIGPFMPFISSLEDIFRILPPKTKEVGIELYHQKQGNFSLLLQRTEEYFGRDKRQKIENIYKDENNYLNFANQLKKELITWSKQNNIKSFFTLAGFNDFYSPSIDYEQAVF